MSIVGFLVSISFFHISRQGSVVAHALVRRVRFSFPLLVWKESISQTFPILLFFYFPSKLMWILKKKDVQFFFFKVDEIS